MNGVDPTGLTFGEWLAAMKRDSERLMLIMAQAEWWAAWRKRIDRMAYRSLPPADD